MPTNVRYCAIAINFCNLHNLPLITFTYFSINLKFPFKQDEPGINPILKVWDVSRIDKNGIPFCFRISKIASGIKPAHVSALCADEGLQLMSVGFVDGTVVLYRLGCILSFK